MATSELNRAIPPYQDGPVDRLGRGQCEESGGLEPQRCTPIRFRGGARCPGGFTLHSWTPARCEQAGAAEDGEIESHGLSSHRPVSGRGQPPGWFILHEEGGLLESHGVTRASASNGARPLADSPSMSTVPGIRTPTTRDLNAVSLPLD